MIHVFSLVENNLSVLRSYFTNATYPMLRNMDTVRREREREGKNREGVDEEYLLFVSRLKECNTILLWAVLKTTQPA